MPYLRSFKYDVFISYARLDNESLIMGEEGWVSSFWHQLEIRSSQLVAKRTSFWIDAKLPTSDTFAEDISQAIRQSALFIPIITPQYVNSQYCLKELQAFIRAADETGGLVIGDRSRIFKVIKTPVPLEEHPSEIRDFLGYEFFSLQPDGRPVEFTNHGETAKDYHFKLDDLAYDIGKMLNVLKEPKGSGEQTTVTDEPKQRKPAEPTDTTEKVSTKADDTTETPEVDLETRPVSVHLHSDLWTLDDRLGYSLYAKAIAEFIHHKDTNPPLTVGIYAPWGQGKTTLMRLIETKLKELSQGQRIGGPSPLGDPPALPGRQQKFDSSRSTWHVNLPCCRSSNAIVR